MSKQKKIAIIGAGASGLLSSILLSEQGFDVTIFEKNNKVGKKLLATGNGRCNVTNKNISLKNFYSNSNISLIKNNISDFSYNDCKELFNRLGVEFKVVPSGRAYPLSLTSSSIVDILEYEALKHGVKIELNSEIIDLKYNNERFTLNKNIHFDKLVVATGSIAMPKLGSSESGYQFAKQFKHSIIKPVASLVQLVSSNKHLDVVAGVKIEAVIDKTRGDFLFTKYGVSGSLILDISRKVSKDLQTQKTVRLSVDTMPDFSMETLTNMLSKRLEYLKDKELHLWLDGIMNKKLAKYIILNSNIPSHIKYAKFLSQQDILKIVKTIKNLQFTITDTKGFETCEVCAGGIELSEINLETMESKHQKNLYFIGEVIDIDGDCGGYNLHWAWSSSNTLALNMR
ncbi:aminoacetone oxidase family FAD-binding enzyme [Arcobacteraceae bacterium]|nr:aminoacetone oxidase family FAD-binding enzyme [Arcobacteraceae bacterium]